MGGESFSPRIFPTNEYRSRIVDATEQARMGTLCVTPLLSHLRMPYLRHVRPDHPPQLTSVHPTSARNVSMEYISAYFGKCQAENSAPLPRSAVDTFASVCHGGHHAVGSLANTQYPLVESRCALKLLTNDASKRKEKYLALSSVPWLSYFSALPGLINLLNTNNLAVTAYSPMSFMKISPLWQSVQDATMEIV
ncbi:hypothetical protein C8J56DRAFT_886677 [Mycena floridula]|nr:hypothetical protein C8J56DRAFT_886677 [Mycena floridula]